jgi:hypothetical protein
VPVTTELDSDLVHGPGVTADLFGDPPSGPIRQHQSLGCDARLVVGPAAARTGRLRAVPPELVPHEAGGTAERGKIDKGDHRTVLHPGEHAALRASPTSSTSFYMDGQRGAHLVFEAEHGHLRQADKQLAHARRVCHHGGPPSAVVEKPQTGGPPLRARGSLPSGHTPLAPARFGSATRMTQ